MRPVSRIIWALTALVVVAVPVAVRSEGQPRAGPDPERTGAVNVATGPIGGLDRVRPAAGGVEVVGWAARTDGGARAPRVEISAHGELLSTLRPRSDRLDLEAAYGEAAGSAGFSHVVAVPAGAHTVCADAIASGSQARIRLGCAAADPDAAAAWREALDSLLAALGREAEERLAGVEVALAVIPFDTGVTSSWRGRRLFISASAPKAWWAAAALAAGEAEAASELAPAVFRHSSDAAAGGLIDLAGGIDAVNDFTLSIGMEDTAAIKWGHGGSHRRSRQYPGPLNGSNHVDATDAVGFYYALGTNQVLDPATTRRLARWLRWTPRHAGVGDAEASTIPHPLPPDVQERVEQKAGWLRPWEYSVPGHLLGAGIVHPANGGPSYAVAIMAAGGSHASFRALIPFFRSASCRIYRHVAGDDDWTCPGW